MSCESAFNSDYSVRKRENFLFLLLMFTKMYQIKKKIHYDKEKGPSRKNYQGRCHVIYIQKNKLLQFLKNWMRKYFAK